MVHPGLNCFSMSRETQGLAVGATKVRLLNGRHCLNEAPRWFACSAMLLYSQSVKYVNLLGSTLCNGRMKHLHIWYLLIPAVCVHARQLVLHLTTTTKQIAGRYSSSQYRCDA
jgi:hypothetical protein